MTSHNPNIEILGRERRRRWTACEKLAIVQETYESEVTVSLVARRHGIQPNQLFTWRKLAAQGALTATQAEEEVVPASDYRALQGQVLELHRLPLPDAKTVISQLPKWFQHYNELHPHKALRYLSPREFRALQSNQNRIYVEKNVT